MTYHDNEPGQPDAFWEGYGILKGMDTPHSGTFDQNGDRDGCVSMKLGSKVPYIQEPIT